MSTAHQTQFEPTRLEDITSFSAHDPSIVAAPIYEENEEAAVEELPNLILDAGMIRRWIINKTN